MSYSMEVKREKVGDYTLVLIDDDTFYWCKVFKDDKLMAMHPLAYENEYHKYKEKYSKM